MLQFPPAPLWTCGGRIAERFTEAQKVSQAMRHFLPKRSSPAAAQSRPRTAPTQQPAKPAPAVSAPQPARTQQPRGRSRSARRHPPPKRQGPRPKIALDPAPPASSWSAGQEEERVESRHGRTAHQKASREKPLGTPFLPGAEGIVFVATGSVQAPMQPSAVIVEKIKHKHSQKESNFPLRPSRVPCLRAAGHSSLSNPLPRGPRPGRPSRVSEWVMGIIKLGYSLQFARRSPRFSGVVSTSVQGENARVLRSEVMTLLEKGAIEMVPPALSESGFYSRYFLVPKKDGGLRPILDLRRLNHALMRRPFRMITLKQILSQIRTGDWFCSLDLKDTYFHIQIAPITDDSWDSPSREWLTSTRSYPLGCPLAPRTFTKCMDAALSALRQMGNPHFSTTSTTGSFWPSQRWSYFHTEPSSSALRAPGAQGQFRQKRTVSQPTSIVPGYSSGLSSHESGDSARTRSGHSETRGHLQERHRSPTQSVSENAGPYGRSIASVTAGPAPHAPPSTLVETTGSTQRMASRTLHIRVNQACVTALTPWKNPRWMRRAWPWGWSTPGKLSRQTPPTQVGGRCAKANRPSAIGRRRRAASTSTAWKC